MKIKLVKKAQIGSIHPGIRMLAGALTGGVIGRYATPHALGYADDPKAVNMSTVMDASLGAFMGYGGPHLKSWTHKDPAMITKLLAAGGAAELMPVAASMLHKGVNTADNMTAAAKNLKIPPSASEQLRTAIQTPEARGAGVGAGAAGLAAVLTGLLRAKTEGETMNGAGRGTLVTKDFLKYVIPAMLAGGVAGNLSRSAKQ